MPHTLTLELSDPVAQNLQAQAEREKQTVEQVVANLLAEHTRSIALDPATIAALREGIADGEAGREQPFEDYVAEMQAKRQARRQQASR